MKAAVIYARLAAFEPERLKEQIETLKAEVESNPEYGLVGVYSEFGGGTGGTPPPEMKKMLEECIARDIHIVFMRDTTRVARGFEFFDKRIQLFDDNNISIWFSQDKMWSENLNYTVSMTELINRCYKL